MSQLPLSESPKEPEIPEAWKSVCRGHRYGSFNTMESVALSMKQHMTRETDPVRGYYSGITLDPGNSDEADVLSSTHEHLEANGDNSKMAVETRLVNCMKTNLSEKDFWNVIGHLFAMGVELKKIPRPDGIRESALASMKLDDAEFRKIAATIRQRSDDDLGARIIKISNAIGTYSGNVRGDITHENLREALAKSVPEAADAVLEILAPTPGESYNVRGLQGATNKNSQRILEIWLQKRSAQMSTTPTTG